MTKYKIYIKYKDLNKPFELLEGEYKLLTRPMVESIALVNEKLSPVYTINIGENDNFAYRVRYRVRNNVKEACHILCKFTKQGKKIAFIFDETGDIVIKDKFEENSSWFYSPTFTEEELKI